jgi:hypothetical protein
MFDDTIETVHPFNPELMRPDGGEHPSPNAPAEIEPDHVPATERLRAFEDEHLGEDVMRIGGRIERGSGSPYQNPKVMSPELRRQHAALEHLIVSEQHLANAHTKLLQAEADHETALAAAEPRPDLDESGRPRRTRRETMAQAEADGDE